MKTKFTIDEIEIWLEGLKLLDRHGIVPELPDAIRRNRIIQRITQELKDEENGIAAVTYRNEIDYKHEEGE